MITRRLILGSLLAAALTACGTATNTNKSDDTSVIYLVRHAEKQGGDDPSLTAAGEARAEALTNHLSGAGLTHIHSTDYARTRETAGPLAEWTGLEISLYDPRNLSGFASLLKATPGTHLVVGHSNTTPELVAELGGDPVSPIEEATEYDRLYVVTVKDGKASSELERYGAPSPHAQ